MDFFSVNWATRDKYSCSLYLTEAGYDIINASEEVEEFEVFPPTSLTTHILHNSPELLPLLAGKHKSKIGEQVK